MPARLQHATDLVVEVDGSGQRVRLRLTFEHGDPSDRAAPSRIADEPGSAHSPPPPAPAATTCGRRRVGRDDIVLTPAAGVGGPSALMRS
jgi:hypothetical protein